MTSNRNAAFQKHISYQFPNSISHSSNTFIYIAFYCYFQDPSHKFDCSLSLLSRCVGPFTHTVLCLTPPEPDADGNMFCKAIHIANNKENKIIYGRLKMREYGFSYLAIPVTNSQYESLKSHCNYLSERKTEFDWYGMHGFSECSPCNKNKKKWFCSQLVSFLLRECGILKGIDPTKISGNQLFLILFPLSVPSQLNGELRADIAYKRITGLHEIPTLSEDQLKLFQMD